MVKTLLCISLLAAACIDAHGQMASASSESRLIIVPQRRVIMPPNRPARNLPISITDVDANVLISGGNAETTLTITVHNGNAQGTEAEIVLPAPEDSVFKSFSYGNTPGQYPARLLPATEARRLYNEIVARTLDPALMEFAGYGAIKTSVFPVPANQDVKVRIVYEQVLKDKNGVFEYVLPRSESMEQGTKWNIRVELENQQNDADSRIKVERVLYCPTHDVESTRGQNDRITVELSKGVPVNPGPFRLTWNHKDKGNAYSVFACPDASNTDNGYFIINLSAPRDVTAQSLHTPIKRDLILAIDHSGSMRGEKLDKVKEASKQIISGLNEGEAFNIIIYNESVEHCFKAPVEKNSESEKLAHQWIDGIQARGGTNIYAGLQEALKQPVIGGAFAAVLFLSDGMPTIGNTSERAITRLAEKENPGQRRIFSIGVGADVNAPLMRRLADVSKAQPVFILPREDVELKVSGLFDKLRHPVMMDVKLEAVDDSTGNTGRTMDMIPADLPDMFVHDQITVTGRYLGKQPISFTLRGKTVRGEYESKFTVNPAEIATMQHDYAARLWASRQIGYLQASLRDMGADMNNRQLVENDSKTKEIVDEIIRLSQEFGIMSEFTSFFADDGSVSLPGDVVGNEGDLRRRAPQVTMRPAAAPASFAEDRSDMKALSKEMNISRQKASKVINKSNVMYNRKGEAIDSKAIVQIGQVGYMQNEHLAWQDTSLKQENLKPDLTVKPGTPEYDKIVDQLVKENRQGILALDGDILTRVNNQTVLIKNNLK